MAFREVRVFEVREVLRLWLDGEGLRAVSQLVGMDRKTVRRYVEAAEEFGLDRAGDVDQLSDVFLGQVVEKVRPFRTDGHGEGWRLLDAHRDQLDKWLNTDKLTVVKAHELLERQGVVVAQRTLYRYALDELGVGRSVRPGTVRVNDGEPGDELQVDFGRLGRMADPDTGRHGPATASRTGRNTPTAAIHGQGNEHVNEGEPPHRQWAILLTTSGQLHGRQWAGSHGRRHRSDAISSGTRAYVHVQAISNAPSSRERPKSSEQGTYTPAHERIRH